MIVSCSQLLGSQPHRFSTPVKKLHVVMNPRAGEGCADCRHIHQPITINSTTRHKFEAEVVPILQLAAVDYDVFETEGTGTAKEHVSTFGR